MALFDANNKKICIASGGFDPLHSGHIAYLEAAKACGDFLIVALNSDKWLKNKKGKNFLNYNERKIILESIIFVDEVINFEDDDDGSCKDALEKVKSNYPDCKIYFCNGGDRNERNIPEMSVKNVEFLFNVGGTDKLNSSSIILKAWNYGSEDRNWGKYTNLLVENNLKVKELIVYSNKGMSFQRHNLRNEIWFISKGECEVLCSKKNADSAEKFHLKQYDTFIVKKNEWHQIINNSNHECKIIEIQYGEKTIEEDIERLFYHNN